MDENKSLANLQEIHGILLDMKLTKKQLSKIAGMIGAAVANGYDMGARGDTEGKEHAIWQFTATR